jgi:hypothetical protein
MNDLLTYRLRVEEQLPKTLEVVDIRKFVPYFCTQDPPVTNYDFQGMANCTCGLTGYLSVL